METLVVHLIRGLTALSREAIAEAFGEKFEWDTTATATATATAAASSGSGSDGDGSGGPPASPAGINSVTTPERTLPRPPGSGSSSNSSNRSSSAAGGGASKALRFGPDGREGVDGPGWGPVGNGATSTSPMRTYAPRPRPPPLPPASEDPPPPLPPPLAASPGDVLGGGGGRRWSEQFFNAGLSLSARRPKAPGSLPDPSPDTFKA